mmetsp:Transcript_14871/g.37944  ORF Transcript_14871/g.37944 Transcript_14871/m.37944 type:complete len:295 (+) Transcript_14871:413-1297(+)
MSNNTFRYKYSFSVEIVPLCREDLVVLPKKFCQHFGGFGPLALVTKVTQAIHLLDPITLRVAEIRPEQYWVNPFRALMTSRRLSVYTILDVDTVPGAHEGDVTVARDVDLGVNDNVTYLRSHLAMRLHAGGQAKGYDVKSGNFGEAELGAGNTGAELPEVVLVKPFYGNKKRNKRRKWQLRKLDADEVAASAGAADGKKGRKRGAAGGADLAQLEEDREEFMQDLEMDPELRAGVNIYRATSGARARALGDADAMTDAASSVAPSEAGGEYPSIPIEEMLEGLVIEGEEAPRRD